MQTNKHRKHGEVVKPQLGHFGRHELAVMGTNCTRIQQLSAQWIQALRDTCKAIYVDADHQQADAPAPHLPTALQAGAAGQYTDRIHFQQLDFIQAPNDFERKKWFQSFDLILVNGNHFPAKQQIVVLDPKKYASLERKLDRLKDVQLILQTEPHQAIPGFLLAALPDQGTAVPVLGIADLEGQISWLRQWRQAQKPPLYGLVLGGGKSMRMGEDKGLIDYHGKPQRDWVFEQLTGICDQVFYSLRSEQLEGGPQPALADQLLDLGPMGALLTAFRNHPEAAWLIVACDLPFIDEETLSYLVEKRDTSAVATAFVHPETRFPEPMISIWEPKSYPVLLNFLWQGYSCPRKVLINSETTLLEAPNIRVFENVNTPEERRKAMDALNRKV